MNEIAERVNEIREKIHRAAQRVGRRSDDITWVAVSKSVIIEKVVQAMEAGVSEFGESYVQELLAKKNDSAFDGKTMKWHFVGRLQMNKVKFVVPNVVEAVSKSAVHFGKVSDGLLQINVSHEVTKAGFQYSDVQEVLKRIIDLPNVNIRGLMCIASNDPMKAKTEFKQMQKLFDKLSKSYNSFDCLSMGMTNDFEDAILCGSTMVRIGSALFGERVK
ncbi:hypothetical protein CHS0354_000785 [Potamilus streckersoni]|uniref:Pyridoxal phosphate homeostasis protein n=1 Tax=Potamilus streckersoni TaxID=2493646 RepID=A0AAE0W985_9BIVA|nr:hypothetical protein CHS0354_000785 [Potamilus streckersoni]